MQLRSCLVQIQRLFVCASLLILGTACTTLQGHRQRVKVVTEPSGAEIRTSDGVVGTSPQFVDIKRSKKKRLWIDWNTKESIGYDLKTTYRWRESFFANLIFLGYAPVGWALDYLTGTAWEYEPKLLYIAPRGTKARPVEKNEELRIAIAPPKTEQSLLSDELGSWMERTIQARYPEARVIPFFQSLTTFNEFDDDHSEVIDPGARDDLYSQLGVHRIVESKVDIASNREVSLLATTTDVFTDQKLDEFRVRIDGSGIDFNKRDPWLRRLGNLASIVPNTVTFDTTTPRAQILVDGDVNQVETARYYSESQKPDTLWHYISGLGIRNFKSPSHSTRLGFTFRFVPSLAIYYDRFLFRARTGANEFGDVKYDWYTLYGGVGPEVGLESSLGHQYIQLIPGFGLNWIHWSQGANQIDDIKMKFAIETEVGWSFFVTKRLNVRLFGRILSLAQDQWQSAVGQTLGRSVEMKSPQLTLSGIALGFYFPEVKTSVKELFQ